MTWALLLIPLILLAAPLGLRTGLLAQRRRRYPLREFPDFLSDEECAHLISRAEPLLRKSSAIMQGRTGLYDAGRQSATALLDQAGDPIVQGIKRRIAELTGTDPDQQERIQITYYAEEQFYDRHFDSLSANGLDPGAAGDRMYTVILYLNDDYKGGSTYFPAIRRRIAPVKGKAVLFGNLNAAGSAHDPLAIHVGERVRDGEKWLSNQWIRQHRRHAASAARRRGKKRRSRKEC